LNTCENEASYDGIGVKVGSGDALGTMRSSARLNERIKKKNRRRKPRRREVTLVSILTIKPIEGESLRNKSSLS